jgi:anti-sigma-K factor RskA
MNGETRRLALSIFAGEMVLGTTAAEDREAITRRFGSDPDFAAEIIAWERRLAPLAQIAPTVRPSPALWERIANLTVMVSRLHEPTAAPGVLAPDALVDDGGVVVSLEAAIAARTRHLQTRLNRWRWATGAAAALAAGLAALAVLGPRGSVPPAGDQLVAVVNTSGEIPPLMVKVDLARGELTVEPIALEPQAGKSYQLWAVPPNAKPVSLGLVTQADRRSLQAPGAPWTDPSLLIAVSVEPQGGSPTGQPTGPVIYKGKLVRAP